MVCRLISSVSSTNLLQGLDLQRRLLDQGHHVPTIFITAYPDEVRRKHR